MSATASSWVFEATNVRDFAFAATNRNLWDATRAAVERDGRRDWVAIHSFYRPEAAEWRQGARFTRHAIEFHSRHWYPYAYPQMTSAEGPVFGMEYPMLTFVEDIEDPVFLYQVINHEVAHQWFPMMVGSNEPIHAWQDEGLATYMEHYATIDLFPEEEPFLEDVDRYLMVAGTETTFSLIGNMFWLLAERALRGPVIYRKLSLGSQSDQGEQRIERLLSIHTTCRLQPPTAARLPRRRLHGRRRRYSLAPSGRGAGSRRFFLSLK
jgi:hypothetical protein